ncbi:BPSS1780 family membrane protein [Methylomagnum ishizawai]|uniref:BPSS1780 family membrane protein n=1 Tax=Methylomagnum ishizawai TaxID=1760988 RepID=UPI001C32829E|nr:BPSS1780 family membrane protein [Methylomagnum ishizawai]BBL73078.1 hypothetical protein MishRS11D_01760 [Methylomagnum ishizawai]
MSTPSTPEPIPEADETQNPYEAPQARVDDPGLEGLGELLETPRALEFTRGLGWLAGGWELFARAPATWIGIVILWMVIIGLILLGQSLVANLAVGLVNTLFTGGLMYGCHALTLERDGLGVEHLFAGLFRRFLGLALIGLAGSAASAAILFGSFIAALGMPTGFNILVHGEAVAMMPDPVRLLLALLMVSALMMPVMMALWFAPALAILHDVPPGRALVLSFQGCLRNLMPFLAYGLGGAILTVLAVLTLGLGWLALWPVLIASTYVAYRNIFTE